MSSARLLAGLPSAELHAHLLLCARLDAAELAAEDRKPAELAAYFFDNYPAPVAAVGLRQVLRLRVSPMEVCPAVRNSAGGRVHSSEAV